MTHGILIKEIGYPEFAKINGQSFTGNHFPDLVHSVIQGIKMFLVQRNLLS